MDAFATPNSIMVPPRASHMFSSVIRSRHVYKETWTPYITEELILNVEEENLFDRQAITVLN